MSEHSTDAKPPRVHKRWLSQYSSRRCVGVHDSHLIARQRRNRQWVMRRQHDVTVVCICYSICSLLKESQVTVLPVWIEMRVRLIKQRKARVFLVLLAASPSPSRAAVPHLIDRSTQCRRSVSVPRYPNTEFPDQVGDVHSLQCVEHVCVVAEGLFELSESRLVLQERRELNFVLLSCPGSLGSNCQPVERVEAISFNRLAARPAGPPAFQKSPASSSFFWCPPFAYHGS